MTPLARRVMEKVRQKAPGTYEQWVQAHADATLDEAAKEARDIVIADGLTIDQAGLWRLGADAAADAILALKEQEPCE